MPKAMATVTEIVSLICIVWYIFLVLVCGIGCVQLFRHYSRVPEDSFSTSSLPHEKIPHVTIIRPCKGIEPYLYECLTSSLQQDYPSDRLSVYLCVSTKKDLALETLQRVEADFNRHDIRIFIEEEDPALCENDDQAVSLGPNPKIRNMSRAYREAKGDLVWVLDCNIWTDRGACGRMVDKICGFSHQGDQQAYKFVHHLPVAVDCPVREAFHDYPGFSGKHLGQQYGGRLDEAFLSSAHAKMYTAINTVAVAPCICGKSSMFRRSHLNALTNEDQSTETRYGTGIDYFSNNICEDHLIGDLLWKAKIPSTMPLEARKWKNHGLVFGDIALQPISAMSVSSYVARRVRWLRVRKYTVPAATLVEPGTESFMCSLMGAYGFTTHSATRDLLGNSWAAMLCLWLLSITGWILVDRAVYNLLQSGKTIDMASDQNIPGFLLPQNQHQPRRSFFSWLKAWLAREFLAFFVWSWAIWGGATVVWRDKRLWVGFDMKVHEYDEEPSSGLRQPLLASEDDAVESDPAATTRNMNGSKVRQD